MYESLTTLKTTIDDAQARVKAEGQAALKEAFGELFAANPSLKSVKWRQYTPYFNDGDPCEFGVHDFHVLADGLEKTKYADKEGFVEDTYDMNDEQKTLAEPLLSAARALSRLVPRDVMLAAFGDHVKVAATREGFAVTEYEHD